MDQAALRADLARLRDARRVSWHEPSSFRSLTALLTLAPVAAADRTTLQAQVGNVRTALVQTCDAMGGVRGYAASMLCRVHPDSASCPTVPALYERIALRWPEGGHPRIAPETFKRHHAPQVYRDLAEALSRLPPKPWAAPEGLPIEAVHAPHGRRSVRILWVDDNPSNNAYEVATLRSEGATVVEALATSEAMLRLRSGHEVFDVIVTDMSRQEGAAYRRDAGLELIRLVRDLDASLPIIVYSAPITKASARSAVDAGAVAALNDPTELIALILREAGS